MDDIIDGRITINQHIQYATAKIELETRMGRIRMRTVKVDGYASDARTDELTTLAIETATEMGCSLYSLFVSYGRGWVPARTL